MTTITREEHEANVRDFANDDAAAHATIVENMTLDTAPPVGGDEAAKAQFHRLADKALKKLAKDLGLATTERNIRHNQGGVAASGEIILHSDRLYVQISQSALGWGPVMYRTCNGPKDYHGGGNNFCSADSLEWPERIEEMRRMMQSC